MKHFILFCFSRMSYSPWTCLILTFTKEFKAINFLTKEISSTVWLCFVEVCLFFIWNVYLVLIKSLVLLHFERVYSKCFYSLVLLTFVGSRLIVKTRDKRNSPLDWPILKILLITATFKLANKVFLHWYINVLLYLKALLYILI